MIQSEPNRAAWYEVFAADRVARAAQAVIVVACSSEQWPASDPVYVALTRRTGFTFAILFDGGYPSLEVA